MTGSTSYNVVLRPQDIVYFPALVASDDARPVLEDKLRIEKGDRVVGIVGRALLNQPGAEQLVHLTHWQRIGESGTIHVPYVGSVRVLGRTTREATDLVIARLQPLFNLDLQITLRASRSP